MATHVVNTSVGDFSSSLICAEGSKKVNFYHRVALWLRAFPCAFVIKYSYVAARALTVNCVKTRPAFYVRSMTLRKIMIIHSVAVCLEI